MTYFSRTSFFIVAASFFLILLFMFFLRGTDFRVQEADKNYHLGESAATIMERQTAFNSALKLYLTLEEGYQPRYGNGKLYYDIGNTYFQLGQYPWAVLYYQRAKALMPREKKVQSNLATTLDKLALPRSDVSSVFGNIFFFQTYLSLPERLQLFFIFSFATCVFYSVFIWRSYIWLRTCAFIALGFVALMLLSLGYTRYFSPIEGVIVHSVDLRRDAGINYAKVGELPVAAGTTVEVLGDVSEGKWFKVAVPNGDFGFIPQESIRLM